MSKPFIIKKNNKNTSNWSGGSTTQLFIYPEKSTLKKLDFDFRLSTATIEVAESIFTPLLGVKRTLLLLEGSLKLIHKEHHSIDLILYETDEFEGEWVTKSIGKAIDFNLMIKSSQKSCVNSIPLPSGSILKDRNICGHTFIYLFKGELFTNFGKMNEGDLLVVNKKELYKITTIEDSIVVHISISEK